MTDDDDKVIKEFVDTLNNIGYNVCYDEIRQNIIKITGYKPLPELTYRKDNKECKDET